MVTIYHLDVTRKPRITSFASASGYCQIIKYPEPEPYVAPLNPFTFWRNILRPWKD